MFKPPLTLQTTTLWNYPSQNYGNQKQGDQNYQGATPSYVIWNLLMRYTKEGDMVVDPMCGSGTTIDVCNDLHRKCLGYDIHPYRADIMKADARNLPCKSNSADFVFIDPPYGDNINYSNEEQCIGKLGAKTQEYFDAMAIVIKEIHRICKPKHSMGLYVCDYYNKKDGFIPVGFKLFSILLQHFKPVDIIAVARHNKTLAMGNYHRAAEEGNFFLRGFNYCFIMYKE